MTAVPRVDLDRFRLRRFVDHLQELGEVETHAEPVDLATSARSSKPLRKPRCSRAPDALRCRRGRRQPPAPGGRLCLSDVRALANRICAPDAEPTEGVRDSAGRGAGAAGGADRRRHRLMRLPFHVQHQYDGAPYISSAIDYSVDPATRTAQRRLPSLMLRSRTTMRSNLTQMSDLRRNPSRLQTHSRWQFDVVAECTLYPTLPHNG